MLYTEPNVQVLTNEINGQLETLNACLRCQATPTNCDALAKVSCIVLKKTLACILIARGFRIQRSADMRSIIITCRDNRVPIPNWVYQMSGWLIKIDTGMPVPPTAPNILYGFGSNVQRYVLSVIGYQG